MFVDEEPDISGYVLCRGYFLNMTILHMQYDNFIITRLKVGLGSVAF